MTQNNPQVPWTDEQWARVNQVIQEEAQRARVAATFLPLYGPLSADTDFVRAQMIFYEPQLRIDDRNAIELSTLRLNVRVRPEQLADPEMSSVLTLFRRAANMLARLEDALIFNGYAGYDPDADGEVPPLPHGAPPGVEVIWGPETDGLLKTASENEPEPAPEPITDGNGLVGAVTDAISQLEDNGHFGPFAVVLSQNLFSLAQKPVDILENGKRSPEGPSFVPEDRILPFLGGGSLLRSSALPRGRGLVVALGGAPIELVVATDMSLQFLQVTDDPYFIFRVFEKLALRIKEPDAVVALIGTENGNGGTGTGGTRALKTRDAVRKTRPRKKKTKRSRAASVNQA